MRPLIGITSYYVEATEMSKNRVRGLKDQDMLMSTMDYSTSIESAGGIPVAIPVIQNDDYIDEIVKKLDGFLFSGGPDINPLKYNQSFKRGLGSIVPIRDEFELKLLEKVLKEDKPVLGICRGFQLINVFFGGTLYQDIASEELTNLQHMVKISPKYDYSHKVSLSPGSKVYNAFNKKEILVNSFHHQAIHKIGDNLIPTGVSEDGIIEAFEHKDYSFVVGVQWHPEMMSEVYKEQLSIFKLFIDEVLDN